MIAISTVTTQPLPVIRWFSPSVDSSGSLPLGNGDIGMNVWVDERWEVHFHISKGDAWSAAGQLVKVGKFRLILSLPDGGTILGGDGFEWGLDLAGGEIVIRSQRTTLRIWVDANKPVIRICAEGADLMARLVPELRNAGNPSASYFSRMKVSAPWDNPFPAFTCQGTDDGGMVWFVGNETSCWQSNLELQGLADFAVENEDPLLHRRYGGQVVAPQLRWNGKACESVEPTSRLDLGLVIHAEKASSIDKFIRSLRQVAAAVSVHSGEEDRSRHKAWWSGFWSRSFLAVDGCEAAVKVTEGYALQRYLNACAGRGHEPIKFNGSLFTAAWGVSGENEDADYRRWGGGYWHQNTRLTYWSMLASGDFDLMRPFFEMYRRALPLARERCRKLCGHEGAFFPETMHFWGTYLDRDYFQDGRDSGLAPHLPQNRYVRYHHSGSLEVVYLAALFFRYTNDEAFARQTLIPLAEAVIDYYDLHFPRRGGKLHLYPAQAIEQWWECENPMPEVAGLTAVLGILPTLPEQWVGQTRRRQWARLASELPPLPLRRDDGGRTLFAPAESWSGRPRNVENPELYATFPYFLHWRQPELATIGRETFRKRAHREDVGWSQDGIQAALLGFPDEAARSVVGRLGVSSAYARFPGFWGPNYDWVPDQCHSSNAVFTLQLMALQYPDPTAEPMLFPAWPSHWSGSFHLAGPHGRMVSGTRHPTNTRD